MNLDDFSTGDVEGLERRSLADPDLIDLNLGTPGYANFPHLLLSGACARALSGNLLQTSLQYGAASGPERFRRSLASWITSELVSTAARPDEIFITNGASQGLDLVCKHLSSPGDVVLVEDATYFLVPKILDDNRLRIEAVATDSGGIVISDLLEKLRVHHPRLLYVIPASHNPTGVTMSTQRRRQVVEAAASAGTVVVADEVYQFLQFDGSDSRAPMWSLDEKVVRLNSFSKLIAPGLRLGWIQSSWKEVHRIFDHDGVITSGGGLNPFASRVVHEMVASGTFAEHVRFVRERLRQSATAMTASLRRNLPSFKFQEPTGGFFVWANANLEWDAALMAKKCLAAKTSFRHGTTCASTPELRSKFQRHMRLCFAHYTPEQIATGIERLASAFS